MGLDPAMFLAGNQSPVFYWDRDEASRGWSKRFFDKQGRMPTMAQASVYSAVKHYIDAIAAAGTDEADAVMVKMRELPANDFYVRNGRVREDGRLVHDMLFAQGEDARGGKQTVGLLQDSPRDPWRSSVSARSSRTDHEAAFVAANDRRISIYSEAR